MTSHESFYNTNYTSSSAPITHTPAGQIPISPTSAGPPPPRPPPKPISQNNAQATDQSRNETQNFMGTQPSPMSMPPSHISTATAATGLPPPVPPHPSQSQQAPMYTPDMNNNYPQSSHPSTQQPFHPNQQDQIPQITSPPQPPPLSTPYLPDSLPSKSTTELQPLLNNPQLIAAFAQQHPSYKAAVESLESAISANLGQARQVAYAEAQLRQLRTQTAQLLLNHTSLQTQWRRKQAEMDDALSPWGPRVMYQRLVSSIAEQEAVLKAVQESFLEGNHGGDELGGNIGGGGDRKASEKEVNDWVRRIREGTTTLEKRRAMRARWDEGRVGGWR